MSIRVVHLINSLAPGGAERLLFDMAPYWDTTRFDVRLLYLLPEDAQTEEIAACPVPAESIGLRSSFDVVGIRRLWRRLTELDPQVLHTHLMLADCLGRTWAARGKVPAVLTTLHSSAAYFLDRTDVWGRLLAWVYREMLQHTRQVKTVACSNQVAESFRATGMAVGELAVVENGIDLERIREVAPDAREGIRRELGLSDGEFVCLTVARLSPPKGHARLLEAAQRFTDDDRVVFLLVGGGQLRREIEGRIRQAGLEKRVRLLGHRADIPALLRAADLFVLPSRWEGRPISVMEAYAAGLPVVATGVGGVAEMVDASVGVSVSPDDPVALHDAIQGYLRNRPARQSVQRTEAMGDAERRFDVRACVRRYEALYTDLLAERGVAVEPAAV
jgi:glycosyltransferase involved in cell wall biosynthesis